MDRDDRVMGKGAQVPMGDDASYNAVYAAQSGTADALVDPRAKYPKPPFEKQSQPWPGLASKMNPRPDHGETSYKGSGRLIGRKALITGGDSGMGRAGRDRLRPRRRRRGHQLPTPPRSPMRKRGGWSSSTAAGRKGVAHPGRPAR